MNTQKETKNSDEIFLGKELLKKIKIFDYSVFEANEVAKLKGSLCKLGKIISNYDICITGICVCNNQFLFTLNKKHFKRINELVLF